MSKRVARVATIATVVLEGSDGKEETLDWLLDTGRVGVGKSVEEGRCAFRTIDALT